MVHIRNTRVGPQGLVCETLPMLYMNVLIDWRRKEVLLWKLSAFTYTVSQIYYYSPMITFTLALVTARLTSLLIDTLIQKMPESLNTCRRTSWHSGKALTAVQMVLPGERQSDITVHMSVGKLKGNKKITDAQGLPSIWYFSVAETASVVNTCPGRKWWNPQCFVQEKHRPHGQSAHPQCPLWNQVKISIPGYITEQMYSQIWWVRRCCNFKVWFSATAPLTIVLDALFIYHFWKMSQVFDNRTAFYSCSIISDSRN